MLAGNKYKELKKILTWASIADFMERLPDAIELQKWKESGVFFIKNRRTKQDMPMNYDFVQTLISHQEELNIEKSVRRLNKPILVIHGVNDETVSVENVERIKSWKSDAKFEVIADCNHTFNGIHPWTDLELPKATLEALECSLAFLTA